MDGSCGKIERRGFALRARILAQRQLLRGFFEAIEIGKEPTEATRNS